MTREIKFRVWDGLNGKYCTGLDAGEVITYVFNNVEKAEIMLNPLLVRGKQDDFLPEQYTGLKDKNGKEIYEGDIVRCYSQDTYPIGGVMYSEEYAEYEIVAYDTDSLRAYSLEHFSPIINKYLEVIGNIHENPNLMEGE